MEEVMSRLALLISTAAVLGFVGGASAESPFDTPPENFGNCLKQRTVVQPPPKTEDVWFGPHAPSVDVPGRGQGSTGNPAIPFSDLSCIALPS